MSFITKQLRNAITSSGETTSHADRRPSSQAQQPARPRGHIIGHAVGEPLPRTAHAVPRGHVLGRRQTAPTRRTRP